MVNRCSPCEESEESVDLLYNDKVVMGVPLSKLWDEMGFFTYTIYIHMVHPIFLALFNRILCLLIKKKDFIFILALAWTHQILDIYTEGLHINSCVNFCSLLTFMVKRDACMHNWCSHAVT